MKTITALFVLAGWVMAAEIGPPSTSVPRTGLVVHVGSHDGSLEREFGAKGELLVHGLSVTAGEQETARIAVANLPGVVTIDLWSSAPRLPYPDHLVNLVVVDRDRLGAKAPSREELLRVLRPEGVLRERMGGAWKNTVKPWPTGMDDWTHRNRGADGNAASKDMHCKPSTDVQWISGYSFLQGLHTNPGIRLSGGRAFAEWKAPKGEYRFSGRDAFNGLRLWDIKTDHRSFPWVLACDDQRVYMTLTKDGPMVGLDPSTGNVKVTYSAGARMTSRKTQREGNGPEDLPQLRIAAAEGTLVQACAEEFFVLDAASGKLRGKLLAEQGKGFAYPVIGGGRAYVAILDGYMRPGRFYWGALSEIVCVDLATAKELWRWKPAQPTFTTQLIIHEGSLISCSQNHLGQPGDQVVRVVHLDAATGKERWTVSSNDKKMGKANHFLLTWFVRDRMVNGVGSGNMVSIGLDKGDIQLSKDWANNACEPAMVTPNYIVSGYHHWIDKAWAFRKDYTVRGNCGTGIFPGYGMIYAPPAGCICNAYVRGYVAMNSTPPPPPMPDQLRTESSKETFTPVAQASWPKPGTWPAFGADCLRTNSVDTSLGAGLKQLWRVQLAQTPQAPILKESLETEDERVALPISAPVCADGVVVVSSAWRNELIACDAISGRELWRAKGGSRFDGPPVLWGGMVISGCRDGWVYAWRISNGKQVWRHLAAPSDQRIIVSGQLESSWPVNGSVVIHEGSVFAWAGRNEQTANGFVLVKLSATTGQRQAARTFAADLAWRKDWDKNYFSQRSTLNVTPLGFDGQCLRITNGKAIKTSDLSDGDGSRSFLSQMAGGGTDGNYLLRRAYGGNLYYGPTIYDMGSTWHYSKNTNHKNIYLPASMELAISKEAVYGLNWLYGGPDGPPRAWKITADPNKPDRNGFPNGIVRWPVKPDGSIGAPEPVIALPIGTHYNRGKPEYVYYQALAVTKDSIVAIGRDHSREWKPTLDIVSIPGGVRQTIELDGPPMLRHGLAIADGRIYMSLTDGSLVCIGR